MRWTPVGRRSRAEEWALGRKGKAGAFKANHAVSRAGSKFCSDPAPYAVRCIFVPRGQFDEARALFLRFLLLRLYFQTCFTAGKPRLAK